jgi:hypothetical protein
MSNVFISEYLADKSWTMFLSSAANLTTPYYCEYASRVVAIMEKWRMKKKGEKKS